MNVKCKMENVKCPGAGGLRIVVGEGSCGIAAGARKVRTALEDLGKSSGSSVEIGVTGCIGMCYLEPIVDLYGEQGTGNREQGTELVARLVRVQEKDAERIYKAAESGDLSGVEDLKISAEDEEFLAKQTRIALRHCGVINPESLDSYRATDGYKAIAKILGKGEGAAMTPEQVIEEIKVSGLAGRGGAGFPTWFKWNAARNAKGDEKYLICNADEGDPGAFMDRSIMEGDPHRLIEGMMIAGLAIGSSRGYIYVRAEYPLAVERLETAIAQAEEYGILGESILGTDKSFTIHINRGAGSFVCGEGSALTASIEGKRGMPRVKPPRTVEHGLFDMPTNLNNVETYANVPMIINRGAAWYKSIGPENSPGTKAFALTGKINNTGLIEVPMGTTLREVIFDIGGGMRDGAAFKAVQIGGPSGGCLTEKDLDIPLDFDSLKKVGAMIGSGGLVVMDEHTCMVEVARFFMNFTQNESCGKCVPCREGTRRMLEILERITAGNGTEEDIDLLEELADTISNTALCGLGKTAPSPVVSTIRNFREEYLEHVRDKRCRAHVCTKLKRFVIDPDKCRGCSKCARNCPVDAISGVLKSPYTIDQSKCIKCGACKTNCSFGAVREEF